MILLKNVQEEINFSKHKATIYFEVIGEGNPVLTNFNDFQKGVDHIHFYEYLWTLGITSDTNWIDELDKLVVQLSFRLNELRVREFSCNLFKVGTETYKKSLAQRIAKVTSNLPEVDIFGVGIKAGNFVSSLIEEIIQEDKTWSNKQFTSKEYYQGIEWIIDQKIYQNYGNRIFGSCLVAFYETNPVAEKEESHLSNSLWISAYKKNRYDSEEILSTKAFEFKPTPR